MYKHFLPFMATLLPLILLLIGIARSFVPVAMFYGILALLSTACTAAVAGCRVFL